MPEAHGAAVHDQHAAVQALVGRGRRLLRHGGEKVQVGPPAEDGRRARDLLRGGRQPGHAGEHGVAHRGRHVLGGGREHLGDVERVPAGALEYRLGVQRRARRVQQPPHAGHAERGNVHPDHAGQAGQVSHHHGQRVIAAHLLRAERGQDHQPGPGQPAAEEAHDVQGRLVGPVHVLKQERPSCRPGLTGYLPCHLLGHPFDLRQPGQGGPGQYLLDVTQRHQKLVDPVPRRVAARVQQDPLVILG